MPVSFTSDGRIWKACRFCALAIWRYPRGQMWRTSAMDGQCKKSPIHIHVPEY